MANFSWSKSSLISNVCESCFRVFMILTIAASTWNCRSWKIRSFVDAFSSCVSFIWIALIFILVNEAAKSLLKENSSVSETSFDFGCFAKTRYFPQANDCSVRLNSLDSVIKLQEWRDVRTGHHLYVITAILLKVTYRYSIVAWCLCTTSESHRHR